MKTTILPNSNRVYCFDQNEAYIAYMHVNEYIKNGINLSERNVVFDIGANIGLFTAHLHEKFGDTLSIFAFEPIPETYRILKLNIENLHSNNIKFFQLGLSDSNKIVEFGYSPNSSMISSAYPFDTKEEQNMIKSAYINTLKNLPPDAPLFLKLLKNMPNSLTNFMLLMMEKKAFDFKKIPCQLKTISSFISENHISSIDLLKIDVEKSELDVINGIADSDWHKIRQTVIEVHDIDNRVSTLTNILGMNGFSQVNVVQEPDLEGTNIYCIYALR